MPGKLRPSRALYDELKSFGKLSNEMAAQKMLVARTLSALDSSRISREVVNVDPGSDIRYHYRNFQTISDELVTMLSGMLGGREKAYAALLERYGSSKGKAVTRMCEALSSHNERPMIYLNLIERIANNDSLGMRDKCVFCFMAFLTCGVIGNAYEAAQVTEEVILERYALGVGTVLADDREPVFASEDIDGIVRLGLLHVVDGVVPPESQIHALALPPERTTIGAQNSSIIDVASDVSRSHLAIWYDGSRWVCQGQNSLNGTRLISGKDKSVETIELPRAQKGADPSPICEIHVGDTLCLGATTRFLVTALSAG